MRKKGQKGRVFPVHDDSGNNSNIGQRLVNFRMYVRDITIHEVSMYVTLGFFYFKIMKNVRN